MKNSIWLQNYTKEVQDKKNKSDVNKKYIFLIVPLIMLAGIVIATFAGNEPITEETKMGLIMMVGVFAFIMLYSMLLLKIRKKKDVTKYTRDNVLSLLRTDEEVDRFDQQMMASPIKNVKFSNINNLFLTEDYVGMDSVFGGDLKYVFVRKTDVTFIRFKKTASTTGNPLNAAFLFDVLNKENKIILQGCADSGKQLEEVIALLQMAQPTLQIIK